MKNNVNKLKSGIIRMQGNQMDGISFSILRIQSPPLRQMLAVEIHHLQQRPNIALFAG